MTSLQFRNVIIGGGVVGLAVAARLANFGPTLLLEQCDALASQTSSRNSGVVHGGFYYPSGSEKTKLCVQGREMLYQFCKDLGISHKKCGKWIVAQKGEEHVLEDILNKAKMANIQGVRMLSSEEIAKGEPLIRCSQALQSSETGIIDTVELTGALEALLADRDGLIALKAKVVGIDRDEKNNQYKIHVEEDGGSTKYTVVSEYALVNSAGLYSDKIAAMILPNCPEQYRLHWCKGRYLRYSGKSPVSRLVYPCPEAHLKSLGVHLTLDMAGFMRLGPDAVYVENGKEDYEVNEQELIPKFHEAVVRYLPSLSMDRLQADMAGIRPKLSGPSQGFRDFSIVEESSRGYPGLVNLVGIESPGLTSCLAIAEKVQHLLGYRYERETPLI